MNDKRGNNLTCTVVKFSVITALFIAAIITLMILFMLDITGINTRIFIVVCNNSIIFTEFILPDMAIIYSITLN